jgi:hypothetical protein
LSVEPAEPGLVYYKEVTTQILCNMIFYLQKITLIEDLPFILLFKSTGADTITPQTLDSLLNDVLIDANHPMTITLSETLSTLKIDFYISSFNKFGIQQH